MYSNTIASTSNIIYTSFTGDIERLHIGGILVTNYRIAKDEKFIRNVMNEFIDSEVSELYSKKIKEIDEEYETLLDSLQYHE